MALDEERKRRRVQVDVAAHLERTPSVEGDAMVSGEGESGGRRVEEQCFEACGGARAGDMSVGMPGGGDWAETRASGRGGVGR